MTGNDPIIWNMSLNDKPHPMVGVMGFVFNKEGKFLTMYRTGKVRSAKNAWSTITGLHELNKPVLQQIVEEAKEEFGVEASKEGAQFIGFYENVDTTCGFHWVMLAYALRGNFDGLVNNEPEKHSEMRFILPEQASSLTWTPGLGKFIEDHAEELSAFSFQARE